MESGFDNRIPAMADDGCDDWNSALGTIHDVKNSVMRLEDHPNSEVANQAFGVYDQLQDAENELEELEDDLFRRDRILSLLRRAKEADASIDDLIQTFRTENGGESQQ